jgi:serine/threonine protein kinase
MGELWTAEHLGLGTEVVIKFISAELSGQAGAAERFAREAAAAAQVNSPHVVKILDYGASADGAPFIVMEKLEGRDLASHLGARGSLPPDAVATIVRQLAKALTKAHAARIVHRDIKPANVFVCDAEGELFVKLLDFGIAKVTQNDGASTLTGVCVGTPSYMSPEQIIASKAVDLRADLWSLGVLTFHCLTGRKPFDGETAGAVLLAIHTLALPRPSDYVPSLPPAVDAWFERACARAPEARFASAMELSNALSSALALPAELLTAEAEDSSPAQPLPTLSAIGAKQGVDVAFSQSTRTHEPSTSQRRSRVALLATAVAAIAIGGAAFAARTPEPTQSAPSAPVTHDDLPPPAPFVPVMTPPPTLAADPPSRADAKSALARDPSLTTHQDSAHQNGAHHDGQPARAPARPPRSPHHADGAQTPDAGAHAEDPAVPKPEVAPVAATPAPTASPAPAATAVDSTLLYVMPDARR